MKTCPNCGKSVPDYAAKCKYCEDDIHTKQPIPTAISIALTCPSCGATLELNSVSPTVRCAYCGNNIVVASQAVTQTQHPAPLEEQHGAFPEKVRLLVEAGESDQAVELLCQELSIPIAVAKGVVGIFESGHYGSEWQIIEDALRRRGS